MRTFDLGRFELRFQHRDVGTDSGPTIHLFGPKESKHEELLRFDCFVHEPHYHIGFSYRDAPFIRIESDDPLGWAIAKISDDVQALLDEAGAESMKEDELTKLNSALIELTGT